MVADWQRVVADIRHFPWSNLLNITSTWPERVGNATVIFYAATWRPGLCFVLFLLLISQWKAEDFTPCLGAPSIFLVPVAYKVPSVLWHCLLDVRKSIRLVKNWVMRWWHGYLSGASEGYMICIWFSWCHCHPSSLASLKSRMLLPFWFTQVVSVSCNLAPLWVWKLEMYSRLWRRCDWPSMIENLQVLWVMHSYFINI